MSDSLVSSLLVAGKDNKKTLESMDKTLASILLEDKKAEKKRQSERKEDNQDMLRRGGDITSPKSPAEALIKDSSKATAGGGGLGLLGELLTETLGTVLGTVLTTLPWGKILGAGSGFAKAILGVFGGPALAAVLGGVALKGVQEALKGWTGGKKVDGEGNQNVGVANTIDAKGDAEGAQLLANLGRDRADTRAPGIKDTSRGSRIDQQKFDEEQGNDTQIGRDLELTTIRKKSARIAFYSQLIRKMMEDKDKELKESYKEVKIKGAGSRVKTKKVPDEEKKIKIEEDYTRRLNTIRTRYESEGLSQKEVRAATVQKKQKGGPITVPGTGSGDKVPMMLTPGSFVLNRNASNFLRRQEGGEVPTMLEPGELVYLNENIPRFNTGGKVKEKETRPKEQVEEKETHPILTKLSDKNIKKVSAAPGLCVTGSLNTMEASGVPNPAATGDDVGNNPRGAIVQLVKQFGWGSMGGGRAETLESPYGTAGVSVMSAGQWDKAVSAGEVPSGALVFQTRHNDWNGTSESSRGYDMAIAQDSGRSLWNGQQHGSRVYSGLQGVIALTPGGGSFPGTPGKASKTGGMKSPGTPGQSEDGDTSKMTGNKGKMRVFEMMKDSYQLAQMNGMGDQYLKSQAPALAKFFDGIETFLGMIAGKAPKGDSPKVETPSGALTGSGSDGSVSAVPNTVGGADGKLLDFIASGEGGYNSMNQGTSGGSIVGSTHDASSILGKNLPDMTIGEVMDAQASGKLFAAGRYQIIPETMHTAVRDSGLSREDQFDNKNQDKLGMALIYGSKRPALRDYLMGKNDDINRAHLAFAQEWASVADPNKEGNQSHYGGGNQALHTKEEVSEALRSARSGKATEGKQEGGTVTPPVVSAIKVPEGKQEGGTVGKVPTMLEPGEQVYMPGQWNKSIENLNSSIPRFQAGGVVGMKNKSYMEERNNKVVEETMLESSKPIIIPVPMGNQQGSSGNSEGDGNAIPSVPNGPNVAFLSDLINRTNLGGVFS